MDKIEKLMLYARVGSLNPKEILEVAKESNIEILMPEQNMFGACKYSSYYTQAELKGLPLTPELKIHFMICSACRNDLMDFHEMQECYERD